jgi:hypothetical protein
MPQQTIHLVFKTHLDIGFTNHAEKVRRLYHERFIPQAVETGEHFLFENPERPAFIWTTGAWLIWDYLNDRPTDEVRRLEAAIEKGIIAWHGLPFTTHTELMSPALFEAGLSYARELDQRFGKTTIGAKMTDVPGHTLGMVPLMAKAGLKFLHLGVNTACPTPDVPNVFRWRAPGGEEIVVMYQSSYGETHVPQGLNAGLSFAHTNDNLGPQQIHQTVEVYREMAHRHKGAEIVASTLDAYGQILWEARDTFPLIDIEIGDSWIQGSASDPIKSARFRALQRVYDGFDQEKLTPQRQAFGRGLTLVAEHTCGVDIKSFLRDDTAWDRPEFEARRKADPRFTYTEASWAEQRDLLDTAMAKLDPDDLGLAADALAELEVPPVPQGLQSGATGLRVGDWQIEIDPVSGAIVRLVAPDGREIVGRDGTLMGFAYRSYDASDMATHLDTYLTDRPEWAILDHDKPGLINAASARSERFVPTLVGVDDREDGAVIVASLPELAHQTLGAPKQVEYWLAADGDRLQVTLVLRDKPANRMPEAGFFQFTPEEDTAWAFEKLGLVQPADRVATHGGGQLQAIFEASCDGLAIAPLDTPLVGPADWPFMRYNPERPDFSAGLAFNIFNNKWGTNFPMWWEGDFAARFVIAAER